jgi:hypothetical protein
MTRLLVHVEGETEVSFVKEILRPHLVARGYESVSARLLGNARQRMNRGGIKSWDVARKDIMRHLKGDRGATATTLGDYYGLPEGWPGRVQAASAPTAEKPKIIEEAIHDDLTTMMGSGFNSSRFLPFVMLHEFEALLFSDCSAFANAISHKHLGSAFQQIRDQFSNPEEIDDSPTSAPSKRIAALLPDYQKPLHGALAALEVGLGTMSEQCPHFGCWVERLERVVSK